MFVASKLSNDLVIGNLVARSGSVTQIPDAAWRTWINRNRGASVVTSGLVAGFLGEADAIAFVRPADAIGRTLYQAPRRGGRRPR